MPTAATGEEIAVAVRHANCLGKATTSTWRLTPQRLTKLYAPDPSVLIYRVLRQTWALDAPTRPLLTTTVAAAHDALLAANAAAVVPLQPGGEFTRGPMTDAIRAVTGERLSDSILEKIVRKPSSARVLHSNPSGRRNRSQTDRRPAGPTLSPWPVLIRLR